jgi:hypothetical protein
MILLKVDPQRFALLPFKGDAPRPVDVDTVPFGYPLKAVEIKPRHIQIR